MSKFSYLVKIFLVGLVLYFVVASQFIPCFIKYVIAMACLLLCISPRAWFRMKRLLLRFDRRPRKGSVPDKEKLNVLIMLFRLRYLEIYDVYARLRYMQQEAGNGNWILQYLKDRIENTSSDWNDDNGEKTKKSEQKAEVVFTKLFDFNNQYYLPQEEIRNSTDLEIELFPLLGLPKLRVIRSFGLFKQEIDELISDYQFLDDTYPNTFHDCFGDFIINRVAKEERRAVYRHIRSEWRRLFDILKAYLIYFEDRQEMKEFVLSLFKEIEVLEEMTSCLSSAIQQPNAQTSRSFGSPKDESERLFFKQLEKDPLWAKSFL